MKKLLFLIWDSVVSFKDGIVTFFSEFKKSSTWSFLIAITVVVAIIYEKYWMIKILLPLFYIVFLIRRYQEGKYKNRMFWYDLRRNNDSDIVKEYYRHYERECRFRKIIPIDYDSWKKQKLFERDKKEDSESAQQEPDS